MSHDNIRLPLGSVTAPHPADSCHSGGDAAPIHSARAPVSLLKGEDNELAGILLFSLVGTHVEYFEAVDVSQVNHDGLQVEVALLRHRTNGRHYHLTVVGVPDGADGLAKEGGAG